jgi:hypothetical protein
MHMQMDYIVFRLVLPTECQDALPIAHFHSIVQPELRVDLVVSHRTRTLPSMLVVISLSIVKDNVSIIDGINAGLCVLLLNFYERPAKLSPARPPPDAAHPAQPLPQGIDSQNVDLFAAIKTPWLALLTLNFLRIVGQQLNAIPFFRNIGSLSNPNEDTVARIIGLVSSSSLSAVLLILIFQHSLLSLLEQNAANFRTYVIEYDAAFVPARERSRMLLHWKTVSPLSCDRHSRPYWIQTALWPELSILQPSSQSEDPSRHRSRWHAASAQQSPSSCACRRVREGQEGRLPQGHRRKGPPLPSKS